MPREESTRVKLLVHGRPLGQEHPYPHIGCIHLHDELAGQVGNLEDGI